MKAKPINLKTLRTAIFILFLNLSFVTFAQNCLPSPNNPTAREIHFNYYNTSATALSTSTTVESAGVSNYTVNVYTFTIPYFQNQLQTDLRFKNQVSSCSWGTSPCGSKAIKVYNSHSGGSLIGNQPNQVDIYSHNFPVGTSNIRVEASCGGQVYQTRYYRFVVQKEPTASVNLSINAECQKNHQGQNNGYISFKATGTHTNSSNLYFKVLPPNGSNCTSPDFALTNSNSSFFSCNSSGTYTIQLLYKSTLIGGGYISQVLNSNYYSYNKTFRSCMRVYEPIRVKISLLKTTDTLNDSSVSFSNPVKEELNVFLNTDDKASYEIEIYDFSGLSVKKASFKDVNSKSKNTINVQDLKKGIYIVKIKNGDSVIRKKMIKE
jgi:hypothetical protein